MVIDKFRMEVRKDGIYLAAQEDADFSLPVIASFLKSGGVEHYDPEAVGDFVQKRQTGPVKIAKRDPALEKDAEMEVRVSSDGLTAEMWIEPPFVDRPWPTLEQVLLFLQENGVVEGIDQEIILSMLSEKNGRMWIPVARGVLPRDGEDSEVEFRVEFGSARPKEVDEQGRVDLKNLSSVTVILKDQILAVKSTPTEGVPGTTVKGLPLKAKNGRDRPLPAGAGTYVSEDGLSLHSLIDGNLVLKNNKLHVIPVFQVDGDVDYSVGNIDFIGTVLVNGAVREGFEITTSGNIEIRGVVEGAHLSSKGSILISGGIRGMNKALLEATADVTAGFIDQAKVRSGNDIIVTNAVLHSDLAAHRKITVLGGSKAQIAGGKIQAGLEVMCLTLGSEMGTKTEVIVGVLPEITERKKEILSLLAETEEKMEKVEANLGFLKRAETAGDLDDNKRALMISLTKAKFQMQSQRNAARDELGLIDEQMENSKTRGRVRVKGSCYPGVTVSIRGMVYIVREKQQFCSFLYEDGEIKVKPYDY
jgi:hypothetical protein